MNAQGIAQIGMEFTNINYSQRIVCYQLTIVNQGATSWNLAGQNYRIFYNSETMNIKLDSLESLLSTDYSDVIVVQSIENTDATFVNGTLTYESDLGFLNCFIDLSDIVSGGEEILPNAQLNIAQICFEILPITVDEICLDLDFARENHTSEYAPAFTNISEWINSSTQSAVQIVNYNDLNSSNAEACIDFIENDILVCTDGIDNDGDGLIDCEDPSCNSIGIICENNMVTCMDGVDNDGDGDIDCDDLDCGRPILNDIIVEQQLCPELNNGSIEILAQGNLISYSIDNGQNFGQNQLWEDLSEGTYHVIIRNEDTGCSVTYDNNPIEINELECFDDLESDCMDGVDNDGDGDIDCDDIDCGKPKIEDVQIVQITCPELMNGSIDIDFTGIDVEFSLDGGLSYSLENKFENLEAGTYNLVLRNTSTLCETYFDSNPIEFLNPDCVEGNASLCNDGLDNDGDQLVDCLDSDCFEYCSEQLFFVPNVFSPLVQDGNNDNLILGFSDALIGTELSIYIYDRWGNQLKMENLVINNNVMDIWDGKFKNKFLTSGTYIMYLTIIIENSNRVNRTYNVTLI